jgi:hypothetical protein
MSTAISEVTPLVAEQKNHRCHFFPSHDAWKNSVWQGLVAFGIGCIIFTAVFDKIWLIALLAIVASAITMSINASCYDKRIETAYSALNV